jgi:hypothetical protein
VSGRLDETVPAFREALQENIRERVPLDWAMTTGNQGAALKLLAKRQGERRWFNRYSRHCVTAAMRRPLPTPLPKARQALKGQPAASLLSTRARQCSRSS